MYKQAMSHWWNWGGNQKLPGKMIIYQTGNITIFCNNFKFSIICNNIKPLFVHLKLTLHCKSTILQWKKTLKTEFLRTQSLSVLKWEAGLVYCSSHLIF